MTQPLNESIIMLVQQGAQEIAFADLSFIVKLLIIIGFISVIHMSGKLTLSVIDIGVYLYASIKWLVNRIKGKII